MAGVTIDARGLTKRFGTHTGVREVNFTARQGEVVGLLGRNGAGKTTTIRLLSTVLSPTSGEFTVAGVPSSRPTEIRRLIGVLPESAGYPGHLTGDGYLRYHARLFGLNRRAAAMVAGRLLADVGLTDRARSLIRTYSRGMRQRLGIARALVNQPAVLFLDEPTLGLDPAGQRQVLAIVRDIAHSRGTTVVLSTHTLPEVEQTCSTVLILHRGRVRLAGTMTEVMRTAVTRRSGRLRVPGDLVARARLALSDIAGVVVDGTAERPDILLLSTASGWDERRADAALNAAIRAVLDADVPVLHYEATGARLTDAFLDLTREDR